MAIAMIDREIDGPHRLDARDARVRRRLGAPGPGLPRGAPGRRRPAPCQSAPVPALDPADFDLAHCRRAMAGIRGALEAWPRLRPRGSGSRSRRIERAEAVSLFLAPRGAHRPAGRPEVGRHHWSVTCGIPAGRPAMACGPTSPTSSRAFTTDNSYNLCRRARGAALPASGHGRWREPHRQPGVGAHNEMRRRHPDLLAPVRALLLRPAARARPRRRHGHASPHLRGRRASGSTAACHAHQVRNGQAMAARRSTPGEAALDELDRVMDQPELRMDFHFEAGQMQFVNNRHHRAQADGVSRLAEPERERHLVRLWLRDAAAPLRPHGIALARRRHAALLGSARSLPTSGGVQPLQPVERLRSSRHDASTAATTRVAAILGSASRRDPQRSDLTAQRSDSSAAPQHARSRHDPLRGLPKKKPIRHRLARRVAERRVVAGISAGKRLDELPERRLPTSEIFRSWSSTPGRARGRRRRGSAVTSTRRRGGGEPGGQQD